MHGIRERQKQKVLLRIVLYTGESMRTKRMPNRPGQSMNSVGERRSMVLERPGNNINPARHSRVRGDLAEARHPSRHVPMRPLATKT